MNFVKFAALALILAAGVAPVMAADTTTTTTTTDASSVSEAEAVAAETAADVVADEAAK